MKLSGAGWRRWKNDYNRRTCKAFRPKRVARVERFSATPDPSPPGLVAMLQMSPKSCWLQV